MALIREKRLVMGTLSLPFCRANAQGHDIPETPIKVVGAEILRKENLSVSNETLSAKILAFVGAEARERFTLLSLRSYFEERDRIPILPGVFVDGSTLKFFPEQWGD